ncbi:MAG: TIGR03984 family CRISPR-associated protein [Leptolyngbya sp. SIOISBB]|nr:TIGR03984 family CRISPR-associated protein [Leptolyngbya sp. SIOISBB]
MTQDIQATTLHSYHAYETLPLGDAINSCKSVLQEATALLYSPQACVLARLDLGGTLRDASANKISLDSVFEARIFNENCELRWLNELDASGRAALVVESEISAAGFTHIEAKSCESLAQQYLLWGERVEDFSNDKGWQRLAEARIGKLDIPVAQSFLQEQRVYLKTLEYLAVADKYGNFAVIEERLVKLEVK